MATNDASGIEKLTNTRKIIFSSGGLSLGERDREQDFLGLKMGLFKATCPLMKEMASLCYPHDPQAQQQHKGFTYEFLGANS
jgi:hypothetical protein